ncbi:site-specific integrase [Pectinatus frisingensis]|uniref:site-specific integrase n=1 Tax=Pectinatus frisingensis TaxID=865 RepID=UPI0018C77615|nr:site-specific integrase [Pectinatus frisingensis]
MIYLRKSYYAVVVLALTTGMRQGEIFGLKWENISFSKKSLYVADNMVTSAENGELLDSPKTVTSKRNILLPNRTIEILKKWQKYQGDYAEKWLGVYENTNKLVFTNSFGKMVSITNFTKRYFRKMLRAANISDDVTFHTLRHTHATQLLKHGVNIKVVSERLGHSSTSVTMNIYAHALPDMQNEAVDELNRIY